MLLNQVLVEIVHLYVKHNHMTLKENMTLKEKLKEYFSIFCLLKTPILTYETLLKRSNFLKVFMYFQNNKYSLNCNIVVFLFLYLLRFLVNF